MTLASTTNTVDPEARGFHGSIDDLLIRVAATQNIPARVTTLPVSPPKIDTSTNPEDMIDDVGAVFSRSDFQGGDGLLVAHRSNGDPSDATRYRSGSGIIVVPDDPGDHPSYVTLGRVAAIDTDLGTSTPIGATPRQMMCFVSDSNAPYMVYTRGVNLPGVYIRPNPANSTAVSLETPFTSAPVFSVTEHNGDAYAVHPSVGVAQRQTGAWNVVASDQTLLDALPESLWSAKGRLIAAGRNRLVDVVPGGTSEVLATGGGKWVGVVDAGAFVLAANIDGYVYAFTYEASSGDWALAAQTEVGPGVTITSMVASYGRVYVGTEWRGRGHSYKAIQQSGLHGALWVADVETDGALGNLDRIRVWEDTAPSAMTVFKDEILVYVAPDVWRLDPSVGVGLHRILTVPDDVPYPLTLNWRIASILGVSMVEGDAILDQTFVLTTGQTSGIQAGAVLYSEVPDTYATAGTIVLPAADFYNAGNKNWLEVLATGGWRDVDTGDRVTSGSGLSAQVGIWIAALDAPDAEPVWLQAGVLSGANSMSGTFTLSGPLLNETLTSSEWLGSSRYVAVKAVLNQNGAPETLPALYSVSVRGVPVADERIYQIPVNVSDLIEAPYRKPFRRRGQGELTFQALKAKEGTQVDLTMYRPALSVTGVVESVDTPISGFTPRGSATTVSMVTIRGKDAS